MLPPVSHTPTSCPLIFGIKTGFWGIFLKKNIPKVLLPYIQARLWRGQGHPAAVRGQGPGGHTQARGSSWAARWAVVAARVLAGQQHEV